MATATDKEIAGAVKWAGFRGERAVTAIAVALAESGGRLDAVNVNTDGSKDRGLWQINSKAHPGVSDDCAFRIHCATRQAWLISGMGRSFNPWVAYKSGAYRKHLPRARTAWGAGDAPNPDTAAEKALPLPDNPVNAIADVLQDVGRFFGALLNPHTWLRVAEVIGGLALIIAGLWILGKDQLPPGMRRLAGAK